MGSPGRQPHKGRGIVSMVSGCCRGAKNPGWGHLLVPEHMWLVLDAITSSKPLLPSPKVDVDHTGVTDGFVGG